MLENIVEKDEKIINLSKEELFKAEALQDFKICCISREASLMARKEVLTGKAKFGIAGAGKEVPQVAMARAFKKGDWRSGYYRDQTFMFALGLSRVEDFFAQLYADSENDPFSGGRQMNSHYSSPSVENGEWTDHNSMFNISADVSCTAGQMARAVGIALASKKYRENAQIKTGTNFSDQGNEVSFCTIGDASTSEGVFWESVNAAGVQKIPLAIFIWDDGYGISVPTKYQTTKGSISTILDGFKLDKKGNGISIHKISGWDYEALRKVYDKGLNHTRKTHTPSIFHVVELTQPQGHSTSGSHERYKSKERLAWEKEYDCIEKMKQWMIDEGMASVDALDKIEGEAKIYVKECRDRAWNNYMGPVRDSLKRLQNIYATIVANCSDKAAAEEVSKELKSIVNPVMGEVYQNARRMFFLILKENIAAKDDLISFLDEHKNLGEQRYHTNLYSSSKHSALNIPVIPAKFSDDSPLIPGYQVLNKCFDRALEKNPAIYAFGEDVGFIGDVNQGFAGLQDKYGEERVFDTGIREWTIMGQALGMAMRGLRPIAEIQYLDYLVYGLQPLTDDLATLRYRSNGWQQAPAIIRTRGHRLEGIWHAGSPIGMLIHSLRGMYIAVPRNMTQAAGFYNTLLRSDDPGLVIECLNGYRLRERLPDNVDEFTVPFGVPEILQEGTDVTLVTYGSCIRVAQKGIELLAKQGISVELIDVQSLLPFDLEHQIVESLKKTNRIVFMDEDVPGGATSYMMQEVLEIQKGYQYLDAQPKTLTASDHRTPYGSDGDYFSKPNPEDVFDVIYDLMHEAAPNQFPKF